MADTPDGNVTGYNLISFSSPCNSYYDIFPDPVSGEWKCYTPVLV